MSQIQRLVAKVLLSNLYTVLKRKVFVLPLFVAYDFVLFGAGIVICIVSFKMFMVTTVSFLVFFLVLGVISSKCLKLKTKEQRRSFTVLKLILITFWSMCYMIWAHATYENTGKVVIIHAMPKSQSVPTLFLS